VSGGLRVTSGSARADRLRARAPRAALLVALAVLSLAGLRATLAEGPGAQTIPARTTVVDQGAMAFAESFARAYLGYDAGRPELRERALRDYVPDELEPDLGPSPPAGSRSVSWTVVEADRVQGDRHTVTVAAQTSEGLVHLAVPIARDRRGFLSVPTYPALVGSPAHATDAESPSEDEVEDGGLHAVAERAVRNYLAGDRRDLLADLAPGTVVSLPTEALRLRSLREIAWARPGRTAAVLVEAEDASGGVWNLRYELGVVKRDRWYVRSFHVDPREGGGAP
jgi:hypothetical protein